MSLLQEAPQFSVGDAERLARDLYGLHAHAKPLPSERDQNFLLTPFDPAPAERPASFGGHAVPAGEDGRAYVLKIANATEDRAMLEAQNAAMAHLAQRVTICPRALPTSLGELIAAVPGTGHFVRLVTYLDGVPFAEVDRRTPALFESLGAAVGRLDAALADFDHPAIHRAFHWDLANAHAVIGEHLPRLRDGVYRDLVARVSRVALEAVEPRQRAFRRSAVHHDANDWNVLVSNPDSRCPSPDAGTSSPDITGIIDFGDMVYSWTVADPAVAAAYAMLEAPDPIAVFDAVISGYQPEHPLSDEERAAAFPLACLRLCMSACIAAWQQEQRPDDDYLAVSQEPIQRTLPALARALENGT